MNQARKSKYPEYVPEYPGIVHSIYPGECVSSTVYSVPIFDRFVHLMELGTLILSAKEISGKQEMVAKNAQDPSEKPETVLQKQLVVDEGEEIMVPKTETETETMVTENNQHPLLPDQPDLPPTTEDLKALVKMLPAPWITVGTKTTTTEITEKVPVVITETDPNHADLNRPLITEDLQQPLQTVGHKTTTEITVVIIAVPHKIAWKLNLAESNLNKIIIITVLKIQIQKVLEEVEEEDVLVAH